MTKADLYIFKSCDIDFEWEQKSVEIQTGWRFLSIDSLLRVSLKYVRVTLRSDEFTIELNRTSGQTKRFGLSGDTLPTRNKKQE